MYTVDRRSRAIASSASPRTMPSAGHAMWMPISTLPLGSSRSGERIVDLGRGRVVDRERAHRRQRKFGRRRQRAPRRERHAARKRLGEERVEVIVVRGRNAAARGEQVDRIGLLGVARGGQRLPFERVLVRLVEQHRQARAQRVRATSWRAIPPPTPPSAPLRAACARSTRARPSARRAAPCGTGPCPSCRSASATRAAASPRRRPARATAARRDTRARVRRSRTRRRRSLPTGTWDRAASRGAGPRPARRRRPDSRSAAARCRT